MNLRGSDALMDRAAGDTQPLHLPGPGLPPGAVAAGLESGRIVAAGGGEVVWFTTNRMTLKATAESTGGAFGLVEAIGHAGSGPPLHVHHREHEAFWVLEGLLTVRCGEKTFSAGPGSFTFLPRGVPHTFAIEGDSRGRILSICTPGGFERYFVAAGRPAEHDGLPPAGPPDVGMLARVGRDFGLEIVGPPIAPNNRPSA